MILTDKDTLEALYRQYYTPALLYCTSLCGDTHLAQDLVADAFVKAYISLPESIPSFRYWLMRVCKNLWIDHLRRQRFHSPERSLSHLSDGITPESQYIRSEQQKVLWSAIYTLPPQDREILTLHYFSHLPLGEIAGMTGISYAALRQRLSRLRKTLKQRLEEQGYGF